MSYVRFGISSDVYVINTVKDGKKAIECLGCSLFSKAVPARDPVFYTVHQVITHLDAHRKNADLVPDHAYASLHRRGHLWLMPEKREAMPSAHDNVRQWYTISSGGSNAIDIISGPGVERLVLDQGDNIPVVDIQEALEAAFQAGRQMARWS